MSKRYGRSRIAELEAEVAALKKDNREMFDCAKRLSEEIECAKRIVGEYCVAFQPRSQTVSMRHSDFIEIMEYEKQHNVGVYKYWDFNPGEMLAPISMNRIRLPVMCVLADREHIRSARHMSVVYDGKAWAYAIDRTAWHMTRYPRDLCRNIAERLTHMIYEEMIKDSPVAQRRTHTRDEPDPRTTYPNFNFGLPELPDFLR
jgi:hypothetical protein